MDEETNHFRHLHYCDPRANLLCSSSDLIVAKSGLSPSVSDWQADLAASRVTHESASADTTLKHLLLPSAIKQIMYLKPTFVDRSRILGRSELRAEIGIQMTAIFYFGGDIGTY